MTNIAEHAVPGMIAARRPGARRRVDTGRRACRCRDKRWPAMAAALASLRDSHRRSVRIVDADCGSGSLLLCAVRHARALGFTAIEARGVGAAPGRVARARIAAAMLRDPAIGISFETDDVVRAMTEEADFPADIVIWHGGDPRAARAVAAAGRALIADPVMGAAA